MLQQRNEENTMTAVTLKSAENKIQLAQDLLERVVEQNNKFPGSGATEKDLSQAKELLQEMLSLLPALASQASNDTANDHKSEQQHSIQQAFNKAASLISSIYDDIQEAHVALEGGKTQSRSIEQAETHIMRLVKHCHQAREHLLFD
jgi:uncharacterized membrane protein YccC